MPVYESLVRKLLFRMDPERAHELAFWFLRRGLVRSRVVRDSVLEQNLFGVAFANPIGLAAGFDKNAVAVDHWHRLGFGFVEVGTVTKHAQPGNPKPRLFRLTADRALVNRLGFNNEGADAVQARLRQARPQIPLGINIGKSRVTALEEAADDYAASYEAFSGLGDYFVVNVSSPNTPGLRTLQEKGPLIEILGRLKAIDEMRPLFLKVAPDLVAADLDEIVTVAHELRLTGIIATNTTISREGLMQDPHQDGGLSGAPLFEKSNEVIRFLHQSCDPSMVLIGVGGIFTADDLYRKIALGAHLCQIYTGWIYGGPGTVPRLLTGLLDRMRREGIANVSQLRGRDAV